MGVMTLRRKINPRDYVWTVYFLCMVDRVYTDMTATFGRESYKAFRGSTAVLMEKLGIAIVLMNTRYHFTTLPDELQSKFTLWSCRYFNFSQCILSSVKASSHMVSITIVNWEFLRNCFLQCPY